MTARDTSLLVYGANGYTGRLLLEQLRARGIPFWVAGRDAGRVASVASEFDAPSRVFALDDPATVDKGLAGIQFVVNAAGPFLYTLRPLLTACLRAGIHYLDISGEVEPFDVAAASDREAHERGIMVLPGIGFDVVPSDCLAVHLARRLPGADRLELSISIPDLISRGSAATIASHLSRPVYVRRAGSLEPVWLRNSMRWVDFGQGPRLALGASWGDLVTAFHSTGIANIQVYFEASIAKAPGMIAGQMLAALPGTGWARPVMQRYVSRMPVGPDARERSGRCAVIVVDAWQGRQHARARLTTSEPYTFTAQAGTRVIEHVVDGGWRKGFQTPGTLLGADFVTTLPGVFREDLS
jgi:short subunit dehydrogenase-like uncharacterized protein